MLDPACGSGNFLYLSLQALKDLEHRAGLDAETFGVAREFPTVGPQQVKGIELNSFAAELARVTIWIGEIQWMRRNGFDVSKRPILKPLDSIECKDAILAPDGGEPPWPEADAIIGNPPFLGGKLMRGYLGDAYVQAIFKLYRGWVPAEADLVCYWFAKSWSLVAAGHVERCGLVATNSIRGGANRRVLEHRGEDGVIFDAWDDEPWVVDGRFCPYLHPLKVRFHLPVALTHSLLWSLAKPRRGQSDARQTRNIRTRSRHRSSNCRNFSLVAMVV